MKIIYFISVHGHGRGGHFHSLNHISRVIGSEHRVKIISFGPGKSDIIASNPFFRSHIDFNGLNFFKLQLIIKQEVQVFQPNIIHCFDEGSYNIVRLITPSNKYKLVLNKCGGPNPKNFSHVQNLILFSLENQEWFQAQKKFNSTNIHLIPNRVKPLNFNPDFTPIKKNTENFIFLRVCRIGYSYKKSIVDSINLISMLLEANFKNVKLYLIGVVQNADIFEEFKKHELVKNGHLKILTDSTFTYEASKMLYLADAVIGTGRGLMEAASLGKPILAIDKNGEIPVLLNDRYFNDAFKTNFSERNVFPKLNKTDNIKSIAKLISDSSSYQKNCSFVKQIFEKYFSLENAKEAYLKAYKEAKFNKRELLVDIPYIVKSMFNFYRSYSKLKQ